MTVKELIAELSKCPEKNEVHVRFPGHKFVIYRNELNVFDSSDESITVINVVTDKNLKG